MRVVCVSYRDWALKIYDNLTQNTDHLTLIIRSKEQFDEEAIISFQPDIILFYGWSWLVSNRILAFPSIMLHPSPLPKYRGGSPIQNQIAAGEKQSAVTLFKMTDKMDEGDILVQESFSLEGHLSEILDRITEIGTRLTHQILNGYNLTPQQHEVATYCKRRIPTESELTLEEIQTKDSTWLFNKIRMLEDPYPNAFIKTIDGKKILIKRAEISK